MVVSYSMRGEIMYKSFNKAIGEVNYAGKFFTGETGAVWYGADYKDGTGDMIIFTGKPCTKAHVLKLNGGYIESTDNIVSDTALKYVSELLSRPEYSQPKTLFSDQKATDMLRGQEILEAPEVTVEDTKEVTKEDTIDFDDPRWYSPELEEDDEEDYEDFDFEADFIAEYGEDGQAMVDSWYSGRGWK